MNTKDKTADNVSKCARNFLDAIYTSRKVAEIVSRDFKCETEALESALTMFGRKSRKEGAIRNYGDAKRRVLNAYKLVRRLHDDLKAWDEEGACWHNCREAYEYLDETLGNVCGQFYNDIVKKGK